MMTAAFLTLFALTVIAVFGIGWAREYEKRLRAEAALIRSETARLQWEAKARRLSVVRGE